MTADLFTPALEALLRANLTASALILLVFATRKLVRQRFGARIAYGLWLLPLFGAAASLLPARTAAPVFAAAPSPVAAQAVAASDALPSAAAAAILPTTEAAVFQAPVDLMAVAGALWLAGAVFSVTWLVLRQRQFNADMRQGRAGPAVVGFLRPKVVLPDDFDVRYDARERAVVLTHETTHLARQDARVVALAAFLRCLNWFNPLVHLAVFHLRMDQELACDAQVVQAHPGVRRAYAETMLKAQMAARPLPLGCYWPSGSAHPLTERITLLTAKGPSRVRAVAGAGLVLALGLGCGFAAWAAKPTAPAAVILTPSGLSPQDASDAALAARYARSRNLPLTQAPVQVGGLIRGLRDAGVLDENLNPTGHTATNLGGGKVSSDGQVRDGQLLDIAFNAAGQPVLKPVKTGKTMEIELPAVAPGKMVEILATGTAPDGKAIRNQRRVSYDRMGSRGAYNGNGSAYVLGVETAQQGEGAKVAVTLWRNGKAEATGKAVMADGETRSLTLSNGMTVKLHAAVRNYSPRQEARTPFQAESYAWTSTLAAETAELKARQARAAAERQRSAAAHQKTHAAEREVHAAEREVHTAERKADLARDVADDAAAQARANAARLDIDTSDLGRDTMATLRADRAVRDASRAVRDAPTDENKQKLEEAQEARDRARKAQAASIARVQQMAMTAASSIGRDARRFKTDIEPPPTPSLKNFDYQAYGAAWEKWGEDFGKQFGKKVEDKYGKPRPADSPATPQTDKN